MHQAIGTSCAKIILIGEHAVVYRQPAIALPIKSIRLTATLTPRQGLAQTVRSSFYTGALAAAQPPFSGITKLIRQLLTFFDARSQGFTLTLTSALPAERGMGSSAACAVAIVRAFYAAFDARLDRATLLNWAAVSEKAIHGNPSGLDAATTSADRPQWFVRGQAPRPIHFPRHGFLVIADSGEMGQTGAAVGHVADLLRQDHARYQPLIAGIGHAARQAAVALAQDDLKSLGTQLTAAQAALAALGVSDNKLDALVAAAMHAGALGAKLTGSGQGGCLIALAVDHAGAAAIEAALKKAGAVATWQYDFSESEALQ
ncbi:mevalonate kinase [Lacticaseibacillus jixianensis]|uniref:Mevalonate kinase n=1 Tax=Lacticaseibacillus jixianensis TaxID=2486012 RepID=A0ABW4BCH3_9LACO|nr:mevalonate kinase [Lacticaseibacillus jixianensis]